jgi:hypothetical protein
MDDTTLQDLENELKALRPRRPSVLLRARLEHELSHSADSARPPAANDAMPAAAPRPRYTSATSLRSWKWFSWQMAAAASVALAVSLAVWRWQSADASGASAPQALTPAPAPQPTAVVAPETAESSRTALAAADTYRPVKAANVLYDLQDEGPVLLEDNTPARRIRARYVDTYTWKNPATKASLKWSVPRDEVRVLPASFH